MRPGATRRSGSALSRFGVFEAGRASVRDPKYTADRSANERVDGNPSRRSDDAGIVMRPWPGRGAVG